VRNTTMIYRDGPEDTARAIRRLEEWHRVWEINHPDRVISPTFASEWDITHEHDWVFDELSARVGKLADRCVRCRVRRAHVAGTPSARYYYKSQEK
jgi:hypothetical protein